MCGSVKPFVSVIIPNYNYACFLDRRMQSVLNQTYRNFEVIFLDDCSTDDSIEVFNKYKDDSHVSNIVVNDRNSGSPFKQWHKGIRLAKGDLIWIAESDDFCEPDMLKELVSAYMHYEGTVLSYSTSALVDVDENVMYSRRKGRNQYFTGEYYLRHYLSLGCVVGNASSAVFSRKAALKVSDEYMNIYAAGDYMFWVEIVAQGRVAIVNKNLNYWRRHNETVTGRMTSDGANLRAEKDILRKMDSMLKFSIMRKKLAYAYRTMEIDNIEFVSPETRNDIEAIWESDRHRGIVSRSFLFAAAVFRKFFNVYI